MSDKLLRVASAPYTGAHSGGTHLGPTGVVTPTNPTAQRTYEQNAVDLAEDMNQFRVPASGENSGASIGAHQFDNWTEDKTADKYLTAAGALALSPYFALGANDIPQLSLTGPQREAFFRNFLMRVIAFDLSSGSAPLVGVTMVWLFRLSIDRTWDSIARAGAGINNNAQAWFMLTYWYGLPFPTEAQLTAARDTRGSFAVSAPATQAGTYVTPRQNDATEALRVGWSPAGATTLQQRVTVGQAPLARNHIYRPLPNLASSDIGQTDFDKFTGPISGINSPFDENDHACACFLVNYSTMGAFNRIGPYWPVAGLTELPAETTAVVGNGGQQIPKLRDVSGQPSNYVWSA